MTGPYLYYNVVSNSYITPSFLNQFLKIMEFIWLRTSFSLSCVVFFPFIATPLALRFKMFRNRINDWVAIAIIENAIRKF